MKALRPVRFQSARATVLLSLLAAVCIIVAAGFLRAAPLAAHRAARSASSLRAALHILVPPAAGPQTFRAAGVPADLHRMPNGRFVYDKGALLRPGIQFRPHAAGSPTPVVNEAVQTFDVFNPPPAFVPTQSPLTPTNLTPVWTSDETMLVFSSNRTGAGGVGNRFHLWAIPINGGAAVQLTDSAGPANGGEFYPTLSAANNQQIAFTSDANSPGIQNLYTMPFTAQTVQVSTLASPTIVPSGSSLGTTGFDQVQRPTFSSTNSDEIIFSAHSTEGTSAGHYHLYYLFATTGGFNPQSVSLPAKITDGPADDTDPAYSQDGQLIAFASTATALTQTGSAPSPDPNTSLVITSAPTGKNRSIFLLGGGGQVFGFGNITLKGKAATLPGTDDFAPAWSPTRNNQFLNPAPGFEYIAFSRGTSPTTPHDIFYLPVLQNTQAGGETGRSREAGTTPETPDTPLYQINAGGPAIGSYQTDLPPNFSVGSNPPFFPVLVNGGTVDTPSPPPTTNTTNDPTAPAAIYNTDRSGTFTYTFKDLTPFANYRVRLHLSDPKDSKPGQRVFTVTVNGQQSPPIDIVAQAQQAQGRLSGLVTDSTGAPLAGATVTVKDYNSGNPVGTNPGTVTTSGTQTTGSDGSPVNYSLSVPPLAPGDAYIVTVSGTGLDTASQVFYSAINSFSRADFLLGSTAAANAETITGVVTDSNNNPVPGVPIMVSTSDPKTNLLTTHGGTSFAASAAKQVVTDNTGTYSVTVPLGAYQVTATPGFSAGLATQTQTVPAPTAAGTQTLNFTLATGAAVGDIAGNLTNAATAPATSSPLAGATITIKSGGSIIAILTSTGTAATLPGPPTGDKGTANYSAFLPTGPIQVLLNAKGFTGSVANVTVVNTPANGTIAANEFTRVPDTALASTTTTTAPTGQNTAIVLDEPGTVTNQDITDDKGNIIQPRGALTVAFAPVANGGDPPIVQGIEILPDPNPAGSSGFGSLGTSQGASAPILDSAIGGTSGSGTSVQPQVVVRFRLQNAAGTPSSFNIYRSPGAPTADNAPPVNAAGGESSTPTFTNVPVTGNGQNFVFTDTTVTLGEEYFYQVTAVFQEVITPETDNTGFNQALHLNTDDNGKAAVGTTPAVPANAFDDTYPTWSPFLSVFSIAYSSNRTVTYNDPANSNTPSETAISVAQGGGLGGGTAVGSQYTGILESQVLNLDPPTLLPYSGTEILHIQDKSGNTTRTGIAPGQPVTVVVRLSDREAGVDDSNVYLQIKDPDSKYQDSQGLEHKVFAKDPEFASQPNAGSTGYSQDSGSSLALTNGSSFFQGDQRNHAGYNTFPPPSGGLKIFFDQRGSVGGLDGPEAGTGTGGVFQPIGPSANVSDTISVGHDGGGMNPYVPVDAKGNPILDMNKNQILLPGTDPNLFIPWGPEYECQVVNPAFGGVDTVATDYRNPYYLAGVDDQVPFSGLAFDPARPTQNSGSTPAEWLQLTRLAQQDGQGGVLYSVQWKTPASASDYFLDVIAYDKASLPTAPGFNGRNWRIYDNVWGFSTAATIGNPNDILVVSDYALGQKFAATTFGGQSGLLNLVPKLYGAESYVTDVDVSILPNAIYRTILFTGADPKNFSNYTPEVLNLDAFTSPTNAFPPGSAGGRGVLNGLGVGSYVDSFNDDGVRRDNVPAVASQQYSLWRVLSRGPVPAALYTAYEPKLESQPAVSDPATPKTTFPAAAQVPNAFRCILWLSPFTGDLLVGPGTLSDQATQKALTGFVAAGGRLCVTGQNVASALTQNGTTGNDASGFLSTVLGATLSTVNGGTDLPTATGQSGTDNRISNFPFFDGHLAGNYGEVTPLGAVLNVPPGERPIRISNDYGRNFFTEQLFPQSNSFFGNWRTDGSLDQLGPYIQTFPNGSNNAVVGQINTITPNKGAHVDLTLAPFVNPIGTTGFGKNSPDAASEPGGVGLIYTENPITATGGTGSKVVFATFGLEGLSTEYYKQTESNPTAEVYEPRNQRQNILHNLVAYLRTGSITGTVRATSGNGAAGGGVPGVTVYVISAYGPAIPGRGTFSATTDSAGNFRINGLESGNYTLAAYRTGYSRTTSNPGVVFTIEGDVTLSASLTISPSAPGSITGKVSNTQGVAVVGATVTFTSADGLIQTATTDANGNYALPAVPQDTYTGVASDTPAYGNSAPSKPVVVAGGSSQVVNFVLTAGAGTVTGRVTDLSGKPIAGAIVTFSAGTPPATVTTATTDANGVYTAGLPGGTYAASASATGFGTSTPVSVTVTGSQKTTVPDIQLGPVSNGTLGGLVTGNTNSTPVGGVTLTITNTATGQAAQTVTSTATATSPAAPGGDGSPLNYGPVTLQSGTYTVTASQNGIALGTQTVTVTSNAFVRADFTGNTGVAPLHVFQVGLNFLSTPYDYSGLGFNGLFGTLGVGRSHVAVWNPAQGQYALDPTPPADTIRLGVGYWVFLKTQASITQVGSAPSGTVGVALTPFWNQIGVPNANGILVSNLSFTTGGQTLNFSDATSSQFHVVAPVLYRYDGTAYQQVLATDTLQPWQAYWIKAFVPTTLNLPTGH